MTLLQDPTSARDVGRALGGGTEAGAPVFFDRTGRRWRRLRALAAVLAALLAATALSTVAVLSRPVDVTASRAAAAAAPVDVGPTPPVIGTGPLLRVVRLEQAGATIRAHDPVTGAVVGLLEGTDVTAAGDARVAVQRYGYAGLTQPTISLTYEAGPDETDTPRLLEVLGRNDVAATFFVTGSAAARHPGTVVAEAAGGHALGHQSVTYVHLSGAPEPRRRLELLGGDRILRAVSGTGSNLVRLPFSTGTDDEVRSQVQGILAAQRLGYVVAGYDVDTFDLDLQSPGRASLESLPLPDLRGEHVTVRMHDGGGAGRARTVAYTERLIAHARANGYTFTTMAELPGAVHVPVAATAADRLALVVARGLLVWPDRILLGLFSFAVLAVAGVSGGTVVLAVRRARRLRLQAAHDDGTAGASAVSVSVVLAAYNEEAVIERTLRALAASTYPLTEILVVDDGSTDSTAARVRDLATEDPRIRLIRQRNAGKSRALNSALLRAAGEIVVTVDADTIVTPTTVGNLVRRFCRPDAEDLAAVAGVVRVGNRDRNILTRWQALEYLTQISVERAAQDHLGAIMIVPGACAAWRRRAVLGVGGYASDTLAEDCDLALTLHRAGWRIAQDDDALSYTEVPETVDALLKQRVRWTYGTVQVLAKRRDMIGRRGRGWLGGVVLPWAATTIALPTLTIPFVTVMALVGLRTQGWSLVVAYMALFAAANLAVAATGIRLARESWQHLLMVPVYRVIFEPLRCYLVYASVISAARGVSPGWNKLDRTGTVTLPDAGQRPVGAASSLAVPPGPAHSFSSPAFSSPAFSSPAFTSPEALVLRTSAAHRQPVASSAEALR